jgi:flagellar hook-length control protein FliK
MKAQLNSKVGDSMNIAPVSQHSKTQSVKESYQTDLDSDLVQTFQGQLQFAENDLEWPTPEITPGDKQRDYHKEIDKKRKSDDLEKATALSYWNSQKQEDQFEMNQTMKLTNVEMQNQAEQEKDQTRRQIVENSSTTKKLNQTVSHEKIKQLKPYLVASALQENGAQAPKQEFAELLQAKHNPLGQKPSQSVNQASVSEFPVRADQINPIASQPQLRNERNNTFLKSSPEKGEGVKAAATQSHTQKSSSTIDYRLAKIVGSENTKETKNNHGKQNVFSSELNTALKSDPTGETESTSKPSAAKEADRPQMKDVVNNVKIMLSSGKDTIVIRLTPEHLGKLEIKLKKSGDSLTGEFKVESAETKKLLQAEFAQLQQDLQNQGIKLEHYTIQVKGEGDGSLAQNSQGRQHQDSSGSNQENQHRVTGNENKPALTGTVNRIQTDSGVNIII